MSASVVALRCRTSDRTPGGARGAEALAPRLARLLGVVSGVLKSPCASSHAIRASG